MTDIAMNTSKTIGLTRNKILSAFSSLFHFNLIHRSISRSSQ
jgi:hypothetical protein